MPRPSPKPTTRESVWTPRGSARPTGPVRRPLTSAHRSAPSRSTPSRCRYSGYLHNPKAQGRRARSRRPRSSRHETTYGLRSRRASRAGAVGPGTCYGPPPFRPDARSCAQSWRHVSRGRRVEVRNGTTRVLTRSRWGRKPGRSSCVVRVDSSGPIPVEQSKTRAASMCTVRTDGNQSDMSGGREARSSSDGPRSRPPEVDSRRLVLIEAIGRPHRQHLSAPVLDEEMSVHRHRISIHSQNVRIPGRGAPCRAGAG